MVALITGCKKKVETIYPQIQAISESVYQYSNLNPNYLDAPLYEFINLGERLEKGKIDPHELLEIYFDFVIVCSYE